MKPIMPEAEIRFAAKTGFLTKPLWREFFAEGKPRWQRETWRLLLARGFFCQHPSRRAIDVLVPNPRCKDVINLVGGHLAAPPFVAQLDHDEIMARSLLRLSKANALASYQTEAELKKLSPLVRRRYSADENEKFPDALVEMKSSLRLALELELTLKSRRRYLHILRTYRMREDFDKIIFIVRSQNIFESITQAMTDMYYPVLERPIGFAWLEEWASDPLTARIDFKTSSTSWKNLVT